MPLLPFQPIWKAESLLSTCGTTCSRMLGRGQRPTITIQRSCMCPIYQLLYEVVVSDASGQHIISIMIHCLGLLLSSTERPALWQCGFSAHLEAAYYDKLLRAIIVHLASPTANGSSFGMHSSGTSRKEIGMGLGCGEPALLAMWFSILAKW